MSYRLIRTLPNGEQREHTDLTSKRQAATAAAYVLTDKRCGEPEASGADRFPDRVFTSRDAGPGVRLHVHGGAVMIRRLTAALLLALTLAGCAHKHTRITEDDPRWNCRTMGNHICGPVTP